MRKLIGTVFAAILVTGAVAGCQDTGTPSTTQPSTTQQSTPGTSGPATDSPATQDVPIQQPGTTSPTQTDGIPVTAGNGRCVNLNSGVVTSAISSIGPSVGGDPYIVDSATDAPVGSCPQLLWVLATTPGGTASSPYHVLFFNHDGYLGTATLKATSYTTVVGSSDRGVQVRYRWLTGSDANCCPSGGPVVITFTLGSDGRTVTPDQSIPDEVANPGGQR
ncbi:LppP/LprE family lipoprotein [Nocardia uniformis]|uniref:LppP/LprE family lipoprotein n=1 Tax=Nocardia uniformis TaxID=53432 RepID=A0A849C116_9NOCA|nr:LppP/LprE family lipoprotein [Nocardia uniformis]NNH69537.1 LppP/LprE family lipoprotein [Nocardia uniformis]